VSTLIRSLFKHHSLLILFLYSFLPGTLWSSEVEPRYVFSLLTYDKGKELSSAFGHSAIRFQDRHSGVDYVYNYGTFDFDTPKFYLNFLKGKLPYRLSKVPTEYVIASNKAENRGIIEHYFRLNGDQKEHLLMLLERNYLPANRSYYYDFFFDNCATRILYLIDTVTHFKLHKQNRNYQSKSFRLLATESLKNKPWARLGINILMGISAEKNASYAETAFLPNYLLQIFIGNEGCFNPNGKVLISSSYSKRTVNHSALFFLILFLIPVVAISYFEIYTNQTFKLIDYILTGIPVLIGVVIQFLWIYSDLVIYKWNLNLLWANPLWLIILLRQKASTFLNYLATALLTSALLYSLFFQKELAITFYLLIIVSRLVTLRSTNQNSIPDIV
jgi:hypothetical protein